MDIRGQKELQRILSDHAMTLEGVSVIFHRNEEKWRKSRVGIGGSDAAKTLGIHGSQAELWAEKLGYVEPRDLSGLDVIQYGKNAEGLIAGIYELDHPDMTLMRYPYWSFTNTEHPFMQYTPDGLLIDANNRLGILEVKTTTIRKGEDWDAWQLADDDLRVPDHYFCQVLHGSNVIPQVAFIDLIALIRHRNGSALRTFHWEIDDPYVAHQRGIIKDYVCSFWDHVKQKSYPKTTLLARPDTGLAA